jgi:hypothetical protein
MLSFLRRLTTPADPIDLDELRRGLASWSMPGLPGDRLPALDAWLRIQCQDERR